MKYKQLTSSKVNAITKPGLYADGAGLFLQVAAKKPGPGVTKSWTFRFQINLDRRDMGLGSAKGIGLAKARELAEEARAHIQMGRDPIDEREAKRAAVAAERASRLTFKEAAKRYLARHEAEWRSDVHRKQFKKSLDDACAVLGNLDVTKITKEKVLEVLEPVWYETPVAADRTRNRIERVLKPYCVGPNPASWAVLENDLASAKKVNKKTPHAAMKYVDVPGFVAELSTKTTSVARALYFTILTAVRSSEAIGAKWDEIDLDQALWVIPPSRTKTEIEHRVPLSARVLELLRSLPRGDDFVFPGAKPGAPLHRAAMLRAVPSGTTTHGFRSCFRDWCSEQTNFAYDIAEQALGHAVGNMTERAYRRGEVLEKRRRLMEAWSKFCTTPLVSAEVARIHG
jgi:integrase